MTQWSTENERRTKSIKRFKLHPISALKRFSSNFIVYKSRRDYIQKAIAISLIKFTNFLHYIQFCSFFSFCLYLFIFATVWCLLLLTIHFEMNRSYIFFLLLVIPFKNYIYAYTFWLSCRNWIKRRSNRRNGNRTNSDSCAQLLTVCYVFSEAHGRYMFALQINC